MTNLQLTYWRDQEQQRANLAREAETERSNKANEAENYRSNTAREYETNRHNVQTEILGTKQYNELVRHNSAVEQEQRRTNLANESINQSKVGLGYAQLSYNYDQLGYNYANLSELQNHNRATENISYSQMMETNRSNLANEQIKQTQNTNQFVNNSTINSETARHNKAVEANQVYSTKMSLLGNLSNIIGRVGAAVVTKGLSGSKKVRLK